jgi:hypothetical protein
LEIVLIIRNRKKEICHQINEELLSCVSWVGLLHFMHCVGPQQIKSLPDYESSRERIMNENILKLF